MAGSRAMRPWGVLTDLLTTALDDLGRQRTEEPGEQGRSYPADGSGQPNSSS